MTSLITDHDIFHIHKILGLGCLAHYAYRIFNKFTIGSMLFSESAKWLTPAVHLSLSLSSFIFTVPVYRFHSKTIIWRELQLHNIIFTSRSVFMMYHTLLFSASNPAYYYTRLAILAAHHYMADIVTGLYQQDTMTTTRDIPINTENHLVKYTIKKYYAISQLFATAALLLSQNYEIGFAIMFPIQLSTFLMTLVRKNIISNNQWHFWYAMTLALPYVINSKCISMHNDKLFISLGFIANRFILHIDKYLNMFLLTTLYVIHKT